MSSINMIEGLQSVFASGPLAVLRAAIEILLLTFLVYQVILAVRGTRAAPVIFGVVLMAGLYVVAGAVGWSAIHTVLGSVAPYVVIASIVIFQSEIRRMLRHMAVQFVTSSRRPAGVFRYEYEDVIFAVGQLSQSQVGALIVLERETGLRTFIQSGVALDAWLSSDLLVSIFQRSSPLHDGGVIVQRGRIAAAACFLPLTTNPGLISSLGTRHRAAIGITEESDCLAIVVSETNGRVSIASGGNIEVDVTLDQLRLRLIQYFGPVVTPPRAPTFESVTAEGGAETVPALRGSRSAGAPDSG
jgi:diadenylate cyclase